MLWLNYFLTTVAFAYTFYRLKDVHSYSQDDTWIDYSSSTQSSLKQQKEDFVTGHVGCTSPLELVILCAVAPIGVFLYLECNHWLTNVGSRQLLITPFQTRLVLEYMVVLLPIVWSQSKHFIPWGMGFLFIQLLFAQILSSTRRRRRVRSLTFLPDSSPRSGHVLPLRLPLLTCYRATVLFMTFVAILAVDFTIFPRRYAKTETQGYGLMDLGAGSFIFSSALVSSFAKGSNPVPSSSSSKTILRRSIPLILLGFVRLVSHKGLEYQEHATEYGIHWNFFFTLVLVFYCAYFIRSILQIRFTSFPLALLFIYQCFLSNGGQQFVENAPRWYNTLHTDETLFANMIHWSRNLLVANREGVFGCIGHLSLYLIGEHIGSFCLWDCEKIGYPLEARFLSMSGILWTLHWFLTSILHIPVSRRSTNGSYIIWVLAHNTLQLFWFSTVLSIAFNNKVSANEDPETLPVIKTSCPPIFESINRHGLLVFVIANLITGLVNLIVNTMACSVYKSFVIMTLYASTLAGISLMIDRVHPLLLGPTVDNHKT